MLRISGGRFALKLSEHSGMYFQAAKSQTGARINKDVLKHCFATGHQ